MKKKPKFAGTTPVEMHKYPIPPAPPYGLAALHISNFYLQQKKGAVGGGRWGGKKFDYQARDYYSFGGVGVDVDAGAGAGVDFGCRHWQRLSLRHWSLWEKRGRDFSTLAKNQTNTSNRPFFNKNYMTFLGKTKKHKHVVISNINSI